MLKINNLEVYYGLIRAVKKISFEVPKGQIISLVGSNGAGKTSTLEAIVGDVKKSGEILYNGDDIIKQPTHQIVQNGIALVPEGRRVFINLSVEENLKIGCYNNIEDFELYKEKMYKLFPRLIDKRFQLAGTMSGGEQQMLAIARALMSKPKLLMLDEPSLGLAPKIVGEVIDTIAKLKDEEDLTVLLVEQNAFAALSISDYGYVLENGEIALEDVASNLMNNDEIKKKYLGG
jgi:branched-chain amino acid transport system ATP-binding protein